MKNTTVHIMEESNANGTHATDGVEGMCLSESVTAKKRDEAEGRNNGPEGERVDIARRCSELQKELDSTIEQCRVLENRLSSISQNLLISERSIEQLRSAKLAAEKQAAKVRNTLSFQLGFLLIHGFKSFRAVLELPGQLMALYREAKRRRSRNGRPRKKPAVSEFRPPSYAGLIDRPSPSMLNLSGNDVTRALKLLRVACIMDEFTFRSFDPECNLLQLSLENWEQELESFKPELVFIESAWRGKEEKWGNRVGHVSRELVGIINWCRGNTIPSAFWNKEDPVHFETFLNAAWLFDYVFTTDIDCIRRYKRALGHERVYLLPFACQPKVNNPIEKYDRKDAVCFAGAYYARYPERNRDLAGIVAHLAGYLPLHIYDRNYGKGDQDYQFPEEYYPYIVGNLPFEKIDLAYKGYNFGINLNSIKQSQTMFARRVFELLGSNTVTISNYSRGMRLLFGDLVMASDDGEELINRVRSLTADDTSYRKYRLAGLRTVMRQHTYQDRFAYVVSKMSSDDLADLLPHVLVTCYAKSQRQLDILLAHFDSQTYPNKSILVVLAEGLRTKHGMDGQHIKYVREADANKTAVSDWAAGASWLAGVVPDDYYGANYLMDLALATRYCNAQAVAKTAHYLWIKGARLTTVEPDAEYRPTGQIEARSALVRFQLLDDVSLFRWVAGLESWVFEKIDALGIDIFNYCKNGLIEGSDLPAVKTEVDDLPELKRRISQSELNARAEAIGPEQEAADSFPMFSGKELAAYFKEPQDKDYSFKIRGNCWELNSGLADGKHDYLYADTDFRPADLGYTHQAIFHLAATPGLNIQAVFAFLDKDKKRISSAIKSANRNHEVPIPLGTIWMRPGIRIYGCGVCAINYLALGHKSLRPPEVIGQSKHLLLTNHYPNYGDLYRNGFVHSRVKAYREEGVSVDVFRLQENKAVSYHEFQDIDVISGSKEMLHRLLGQGEYQHVLVHFLDKDMWEVLREYVERIKITVWVHGSEIQPWHRREYNYRSESECNAEKIKSKARMGFWRSLLKEIPANLKLVFVSRYFAEEVMEDLGFRLPLDRYEIIHNPIDTDLFAYNRKAPEQRKKLLSIRPYATRKYANDLTVQAILHLKSKSWFRELEFRLIGDGELFEEVLAPVQGLNNVIIERRFLNQREIAKLHREYGVFLSPTRMDAQGVSRDEAMSSGMVPVTNSVAAVPEFVDSSCGVLVPAEDPAAIAEGIESLVCNPEKFVELSRRAGERVRSQSAKSIIIRQELKQFTGGDIGT